MAKKGSVVALDVFWALVDFGPDGTEFVVLDRTPDLLELACLEEVVVAGLVGMEVNVKSESGGMHESVGESHMLLPLTGTESALVGLQATEATNVSFRQ